MKFTINTLVLLSFGIFANAAPENNLRGKVQDDTDTSSLDQPPPFMASPLNGARDLQEMCLCAPMLDSARILQYGYKLNDQPFTPVSRHSGARPIFDADKILDYVNDNFTPEEIGQTVSVVEEKMTSFASDIQSKMSFHGSYGSNWLGGSLTVSAAAELGLSRAKDTESYYAQHRKIYTFGMVQLPFASNNKQEIQALMDESTLQDLRGIATSTRADQLVNSIGVGYLHKTYYGATFAMTTTVEKEKWMSKSLVDSSISVGYSSFIGNAARGEASTRITIEKDGKSASTKVDLRVEGGDPTKMEDEGEWKESAERRPVITEYTIYPIYELLSTSGREGAARNLLKQAVDRKIASFNGQLPGIIDPSEYWKTLDRYGDDGTRTVYSRTFSEENGGYSGRMQGPINGIRCTGGRCDNKRLAAVQQGYREAVVNRNHWTSWFSEEGDNKRFCPTGMVMNEIQCSGGSCDNMRLQCGSMANGYRVSHEHTMETRFFSEEQGEEQCDDGYYVYGIQCSGSSCDNIKLYCARVQYLYTPPQRSWKPLYHYNNRFTFSRWFSEENKYSGRQVTPVAGVSCSGSKCDNKRLIAINLDGAAIVNNNNSWTSWFSEEGQNYRNCPSGMVMNEIQCSGGNCDNMRLQCGTLKNGYRVNQSNTKIVDYFSEEQGTRYCQDGYYIFGMSCLGSNCDNIRFLCALVEYYG